MKNEMKLRADRMHLLLNFSGELDAAALEDLILALGSARKAMQPPVPTTDKDNNGAQLVCVSEDVRSLAAEKPDQDGKLLLRLRSERFGWMGWRLGQHDASQLGEFLAAYYPPTPIVGAGRA